MNAGSLIHRVTIEQRASGFDALGQPVETWVTVATVWSNVKHQSGISAIKAGTDTSIVQASIRIRYRTGLDAGMRVKHGSDAYDIRAILPDGKKQYLDLVCQQVQ